MPNLSRSSRDQSVNTPAASSAGIVVYCVHTVRADEVRPTVLVASTVTYAETYAAAHSTDPGALAAAVTSFIVDQPGTRHSVSLWVAGVKQDAPYVSNDRKIQG